jgi:hypothetical protein
VKVFPDGGGGLSLLDQPNPAVSDVDSEIREGNQVS